jgi:SSS family solute:Na+ symporter
MMGWAASAYQYGILATHWYWVGAIPAMLFLGIIMMPFYYISKTHSVPGYLKLRFGEPARALSAITFGFMTVLMSGVNMYAMPITIAKYSTMIAISTGLSEISFPEVA